MGQKIRLLKGSDHMNVRQEWTYRADIPHRTAPSHQGHSMNKTKKKSETCRSRTSEIASTPKYFSQKEISAFMTVLSNVNLKNGQEEMDRILEDKLLFMLGLHLGSRVSEITSLAWNRIDFDNRDITVWDEKKDTLRVCTVSDETWQLLEAYAKKADKRDPNVFHYSDKTLNRRIKAWAAKAGIKRSVRWHMLRHTYVVQSRRMGRDWDIISQQTGDRPATLIQEYSRLSIEDRKQVEKDKPLIEGRS